jgi:TonB family protein
VLATIDPSGMVTEAKLLDSNDPAFAEEFLKVVRTWRFDPVLVEGVPTEVRTVLPVTIQRQSFR